jgi:excisionase family DNA binding protein
MYLIKVNPYPYVNIKHKEGFDMDHIFKTREAAEYLTVKKSTLEAWRHFGGGPVYVKYGRAVRYRKEDLDQFIISRLRVNTSGKAAGSADR